MIRLALHVAIALAVAVVFVLLIGRAYDATAPTSERIGAR